MEEIQELVKRLELEILKTPTGELRDLLCDANIVIQYKVLNPTSKDEQVKNTLDRLEKILKSY